MEQTITYFDLECRRTNETSCNLTSRCPHCGKNAHFDFHEKGLAEDWSRVCFFVTCAVCEKISMAEFSANGNHELTLIRLLPKSVFAHTFPKGIDDISPQFVKIYKQSMSAKNDGYDELIGMGLRRAFEFLIKDYISNVLKITPKDKSVDRIKQLEVKNAKIHSTLVRWVGNDNTHTESTHPEFTIEDMINSLGVIVFYLHAEYLSLQLADIIPS